MYIQIKDVSSNVVFLKGCPEGDKYCHNFQDFTFILNYVCLCVCACVSAVSAKAKRRSQIPSSGFTGGFEPPCVTAGSRTPVLGKSCKCSYPRATSPAPIMLILWKELGGHVCFSWVTAKAQISLCMRMMAWLGATLLLWPVRKGTCARSWAIAEEMAARRMCRSGDLHSALVPSLIIEHISLLPNTWKIHCEQMGSNNLHASEGARWAQKTGFCVL